MSNLISVTVKSIGDQEIADKTHLINNKFIVTATESGGDTSIQYGFPRGLRTIVVDETGLDTTFQAATVEKIALSAVGVNGRSTPAETTKFLTSDIVLAVANPEDSSNSDITLVSGDVFTVDATLSSIVSGNDPGSLRPYKVYTGLVSQTSTNAPTATVLENTLGQTVSFTYEDPGDYQVIISGNPMTSTNTAILIGTVQSNAQVFAVRTGLGSIQLQSFNAAGSLADGILSEVAIEIRIYE